MKRHNIVQYFCLLYPQNACLRITIFHRVGRVGSVHAVFQKFFRTSYSVHISSHDWMFLCYPYNYEFLLQKVETNTSMQSWQCPVSITPDDISRSRHFSGFSVFLLFSHVTSFVLRRLWFSLRTILMSFKDYISSRVSNFVIFGAKHHVKALNLRSISTFK